MPYRHDDLDIEQRLKGELDKAREAYGAASREFDLLIKGIPSGIPQPDGGLRIQQASEASRAALQNYLFALERFSQYALAGRVPEDLPPMDWTHTRRIIQKAAAQTAREEEPDGPNPPNVKFLADLSESDFICSVAQAILLRSQNMPASYREQLTATIRAEMARLIKEGYPLDHLELLGWTRIPTSNPGSRYA